MKKNNKAIDLGSITSYVDSVRENSRPVQKTDNIEQGRGAEECIMEIEQPGVNQEEDFDIHSEVERPSENDPKYEKLEPEAKTKGRPKKKRILERKNQKLVRFDSKLSTEMGLVKLMHNIDVQDIIYVAVDKFMKEYFPKGKASKEGLDIVSETLKRINGIE